MVDQLISKQVNQQTYDMLGMPYRELILVPHNIYLIDLKQQLVPHTPTQFINIEEMHVQHFVEINIQKGSGNEAHPPLSKASQKQ